MLPLSDSESETARVPRSESSARSGRETEESTACDPQPEPSVEWSNLNDPTTSNMDAETKIKVTVTGNQQLGAFVQYGAEPRDGGGVGRGWPEGALRAVR